MKSLRILVFVLFVAAAALSAAKPPFWRAFVALYKIQPDSVIGKTRCLNCHNPPGPPKRNPYGNAVEAALRAANTRMVTAAILKSIEHKDAGDKVAFITKIKHDTPPARIKVAGKTPTKRSKPTALNLVWTSALLFAGLGTGLAALGRRSL